MTDQPNRLSIGLLFLWMTGTCIVLAGNEWATIAALANGVEWERIRFLTMFYSLAFGPLHGLAVAGLMLFLWRRLWTGRAFPTEPGHWILVIAGFGQCIYLLLLGLGAAGIHFPGFRFVGWSIEGLLFLFAAIATRQVWKAGALWGGTVACMGGVHGAQLARDIAYLNFAATRQLLGGSGYLYTSRAINTLPAIVAMAAIIFDYRRGRQRDAIHWAGALMTILLPVAEWARTLLFY
jgi:hypothetical protein